MQQASAETVIGVIGFRHGNGVSRIRNCDLQPVAGEGDRVGGEIVDWGRVENRGRGAVCGDNR